MSNRNFSFQRILEDSPVAPEDVHKTAFVTPDRQYEFTRMPFGILNSGATLVRGLRKILEGMLGVGSYIDDIESWEDHLRIPDGTVWQVKKGKDYRPTYKVLTGSQQNGVSRPAGRR